MKYVGFILCILIAIIAVIARWKEIDEASKH